MDSTTPRPAPPPPDGVPLEERLRVTQLLRLVALALVLLCAALAPESLAPYRDQALATTVLYAAVVAAAELAARLLPWRRAAVLGVLLAVDGIWLAWAGYLTGGLSSPLRYLLLLHLAAITLLTSARVGVVVAAWHTVLLLASWSAQVQDGAGAGPLPTSGGGRAGVPEVQQLGVLLVVLWTVAAAAAGLAAVHERELRRRRRDLEALTGLASELEHAVDTKAIARSLLDAVVRSSVAPRGVVLAGPEGQLALLASYGLDAGTARLPGRPGSSPVVDEAHRRRSSLVVPVLDAGSEPWLAALLPGATELVVVPLATEGRPLGALLLEQPVRARTALRRVVPGLERSASYAALALRNAWLMEQVQRLAATDGLTKIANRRAFEATLERELSRATRAAEHVSLVILDLDDFKTLNDTHGHQAGDEVLRNVAAALAMECREFDTAARYGGEEFAVVLPGCGPEEALAIAERLRLAVAAAPAVVPITASAGVATYPGHAGDADTLVRAADNALYASKRAGRDRTTVAEGVPPEAQVDALLRRAVSQRLGNPPAPREPSSGGPS